MVEYVGNFVDLNSPVFGDAFSRLWNELNWEQRSDAPRLEYWTNTINRSYTYGSGRGVRTYQPQQTHEVIERVSDLLEAKFGFRYEGCFLNGYKNERNGLGWHADDDEGIDHNFPISVVTFYEHAPGKKVNPRTIAIKPMTVPQDRFELASYLLEDGSLFLMPAGMQHTHMHSIPKCGFEATSRISLTYRKLK